MSLLVGLMLNRRRRTHPRREACSPVCSPFILWYTTLLFEFESLHESSSAAGKMQRMLLISVSDTRHEHTHCLHEWNDGKNDWHSFLCKLTSKVSVGSSVLEHEGGNRVGRHWLFIASRHPVAQSLSLFGERDKLISPSLLVGELHLLAEVYNYKLGPFIDHGTYTAHFKHKGKVSQCFTEAKKSFRMTFRTIKTWINVFGSDSRVYSWLLP